MLINYKHLDQSFEYDGSQIEQSWAFRFLGIKGSSIITWIGSMDISPSNLKDFEDIGLEIKSDNMVHFIIEHFDQQPANLRIAYMRQRMLVMILNEELTKKGITSIRKGDDIYIEENRKLKKLTVSIATVSPSSMKIHLGINITSDGTPDDVDTRGLLELTDIYSNKNKSVNINSTNNSTNNNNNNNNKENNANNTFKDFNANIMDGNLLVFINNIVNNYINELNDIEEDISKTNLLN